VSRYSSGLTNGSAAARWPPWLQITSSPCLSASTSTETPNRCRFPCWHLMVGTNDTRSLVPVLQPAPLLSPRLKKKEKPAPSRADACEPHHSSEADAIHHKSIKIIPRSTTITDTIHHISPVNNKGGVWIQGLNFSPYI
jgi:hypothetical protein